MRRTLVTVLIGTTLTVTMAYVGKVMATPASGFTGTTIAVGRFGEIEVANQMVRMLADGPPRGDLWLSLQRTKGSSDLHVQNNVWVPGGSTGWHTHPGHSLIIVTAGTVTAYEGDDPSCTPKTYTAGMGFVDAGGDHVHLLRNEDTVDARTVAVQLIPAGAARRIDTASPTACSHLF
jgi:quercetin dioxygenase-like cupin family protein